MPRCRRGLLPAAVLLCLAAVGSGAAEANDSSSRRGRSLLGNYYFQLTSTVGSEGSGDGQFKSPIGMALDAAGNILVADVDNYSDVKADSAGNIDVADFGNQRVQVSSVRAWLQ
ncbi:hypothetical protein ABPG75_008221 [Micractinium tetrahymenae]